MSFLTWIINLKPMTTIKLIIFFLIGTITLHIFSFFKTLLSRAYNSLEWFSNSLPNSHALLSSPLKSGFSYEKFKINFRNKFTLYNCLFIIIYGFAL